MNKRIEENEKILDSILENIKELEKELNDFKNNKENIDKLNNYYGSKKWFKDKEIYENNKLNIKAGVLSEDTVWNMNEDIKDLIQEMKDIINERE